MDGRAQMSGMTAFNIPATDLSDTPAEGMSTPVKLPRRLRRRLTATSTSTTTAQDIEAKLRDADLRRQHFYESLSTKARTTSRYPGQSLPQKEDLGQRLETKLDAAEQKRLSIISKIQNRLAREEGRRQSAKTGMEARFERERDELGMRVESRIQQADLNRSLILKTFRQQTDAKRQRMAQTMMKKMMQEKKYQERVWDAIQQKRAAAERKRLGLLEAKRSRARKLALQVKRVSNLVQVQREIERRRLKDQLEGRLEKARRLRTQSLRERSNHAYSKETKHGELLSRKLARCWSQFVRRSGTTHALAKAYVALGINENSVKLMPFEQLALLVESGATIQTVKALLDRLESRITIREEIVDLFRLENIDYLLKRVLSPMRNGHVSDATRRGGVKSTGPETGVPSNKVKLSRYPVRVVLCAYMILGHPDAVLSGMGECEISLADFAKTFIHEFELLVKVILEGPIQFPQGKTATSAGHLTFTAQLEALDKAWCSYLYRFVMWKVKDSKLLEEDLVRAACQLEVSMIRSFGQVSGEDSGFLPGTSGFQEQLTENMKLLRAKVKQLSGDAGLERMDRALSEARLRSIEAKSTGKSLGSLPVPMPSPALADISTIYDHGKGRSGTSITENEVLVNEIVHQQQNGLADCFEANKHPENIEIKVRDTMERAFWDGVMESIKKNGSDYSWVLKLVNEVRDELCMMAPSSWREEIVETINVDIVTEMLKSGVPDMVYLGRILEFSLVTLEKLSAPANENELKTTHKKILDELGEILQAGDTSNSSFAFLMVKGLRFVLQEIQTLKLEVSKSRIRMLEPLIKGPDGFDYLRSAFTTRHGSPSEATISLPLVSRWLFAIKADTEREWNEYIDSLSALGLSNDGNLHSPAILRAGASILRESDTGAAASNLSESGECRGDKVDILLRLGLLKLVNEVERLTKEALPETLRLNLPRLWIIQAQLQKVIVMSTSILVLRQTLLSEHLITSSSEMDNIISTCVDRLSEVFNDVEDTGLPEIVETLNSVIEDDNLEKSQSRKGVMANMLAKSLRADDAIFKKVTSTVYLAARGIVLGGSGATGKQLAAAALKRIGAAILTEKLVEAVKELIVMATVSARVHGPWYDQILKAM